MKPSTLKSGDPQSELDAPPRPELPWLRGCLALLLFSCVLHVPGDGTSFSLETNPSIALFAIALACSGMALLIGLRHLLVRPGAFLILLWLGFVALMATLGILRDQAPGEILNSLALPLLLGAGIITTHVAACAGMRAGEAVRFFLAATVIGLLWRTGIGALSHHLEVAPIDAGTPAAGLGFLISWAACVLLLRRTGSRVRAALLGLAAAAAIFGIVRGMAIPLLVPATAAAICVVLGIRWRFISGVKRRVIVAPAIVFAVLGVLQIAIGPVRGFSFPDLNDIGTSAALGLMALVMTLSLRAAWRNSETVMGRWAGDAHLIFLPFVSMSCLLGESLLREPAAVPLGAVLFGFLVALPQFFYNRAYYLRHRENEAAISPQLILTEEDLPTTWKGAFPSEA